MNPKRLYTKNILFLFILIIFSQNCVEHIFQINVSPMGNFLIQYQGTGDMEDLTNSDFPVPNNHDWEIISNFEEMDESYVFSSRKEFQTNEPIPSNYLQGDSIPKEPLLNSRLATSVSSASSLFILFVAKAETLVTGPFNQLSASI